MAEKILRLHEVIALTGLARSTIYAEIKKGKFPSQVKLTQGRRVGWRSSDIEQWLESLQEGRR